jgi:hypothetical protein
MFADVMTAKAKLTSLVGAFTLTPELIDGIKCLRVSARVQPEGLL